MIPVVGTIESFAEISSLENIYRAFLFRRINNIAQRLGHQRQSDVNDQDQRLGHQRQSDVNDQEMMIE